MLKEQTNAAQEVLDLWRVMLPDVGEPQLYSAILWTGRYDSAVVFRGIRRAAVKYRKMLRTGKPMTAEECHKYATGVMRDEDRQPQ